MELLRCQLDATLTTLETQVVGCLPCEAGGFEVVLQDSPFYPESGGQPDDQGRVAGQVVLGLRRDEQGVLYHRVEHPVSGTVVAQIDWQRRFDHMQQHTAQHLITATALQQFGWKTVAFHLLPELCDVDLAEESLPEAGLLELEEKINASIREALPVSIKVVQASDMASLPIRSRRLPEGFSGPLRLVDIEGIDLNTCGGTHVSNLAQIQVIKLMGTQKLARGTRLFYLAGDRALAWMRQSLAREEQFNRLLSTGPDRHLSAVERLQQEGRTLEIRQRALQKELAGLLGEALVQSAGPAIVHRSDAGMDFLKAVANAALARNPEFVGLLAGGEGPGVFLLVGPQVLLATVGPKVAAALGGRGGGAGGLFQGKADSFANLSQARQVLAEATQQPV